MDYRDFIQNQKKDLFWFEGKTKLISKLFQPFNFENQLILNIGVGTGDELQILNQYGDIYIVDTIPKVLNLIPNGLYKEKKINSAENLTYPDKFFDIVCIFDVLEHVEKDKKAILEIYRVLKRGGYLFFTVPAFKILFSSHDKALLHKRRYNKKSILKLLKKFKILKLSFWNSFLFLPIAILRILKKRSIPKTDYFNLPTFLNKIFFKLLLFENYLISKDYNLPIGLSLIGYCVK